MSMSLIGSQFTEDSPADQKNLSTSNNNNNNNNDNNNNSNNNNNNNNGLMDSKFQVATGAEYSAPWQ